VANLQGLVFGTVDGRNPAPVDMVNIQLIYKVSCMLGGAGFLPSTVWKVILRNRSCSQVF